MDGALTPEPADPAGDPGDRDPGLLGRVVVAIGNDLVDIDRMRTVIDRQPRLVHRVFTESEQAYCERRRDPAERYAARFAAKEAVLKALGTGLGGADFTDIEVVRLPSGQPTLHLTGRAAVRARERGIHSWLITMSHSEHLAQVFVAGLGTEEGPTGDATGEPTDGRQDDAGPAAPSD